MQEYFDIAEEPEVEIISSGDDASGGIRFRVMYRGHEFVAVPTAAKADEPRTRLVRFIEVPTDKTTNGAGFEAQIAAPGFYELEWNIGKEVQSFVDHRGDVGA